MTALVYSTGSLIGGAIGSLLGSVVAFIGIVVPTRRLAGTTVLSNMEGRPFRHLPRFRWLKMRNLTWLTLPLGISTALGSLRTNVPRYAIEHYLGSYQLGLFAALAYFMVAGGIVVNALGQSATPRLAKYYRDRNSKGFRKLLLWLLLLGSLLGGSGIVVASVAGHELLRLFYSSAYAQHSDVLIWLMIATAVTYTYIFLGTAVSAMRLFKVQVPIGAVALGVLIVSVMPCVKLYGLRGAAWALIAASLTEGTLYTILIVSRIRRMAIA
jgi:O-antigen/teichoic acid export membrane protein